MKKADCQLDNEETSRDKIIRGAIKVFANNGYEKASTTLVAKEAGISKGLIFHYFGSKDDLYAKTYKEAVRLLVSQMTEQIDYHEPDLLRRLRKTVEMKLRLMKRYPDILTFIGEAYLNPPAVHKDKLDKINAHEVEKAFASFYDGIDYTGFKAGVDIRLAVETINFTLEKWAEQYYREHLAEIRQTLDFSDAMARLDQYLAFFRMNFYKEPDDPVTSKQSLQEV
jgi:TetR/AcrR family transcriptional regulator